MRLALQEKKIKGAKANKCWPQILHLLFANNSISFGEAITVGIGVLKDILREYEACSR